MSSTRRAPATSTRGRITSLTPRSVLIPERVQFQAGRDPPTVGPMPEEQEIKIPVGADFVLPDLDGSSRGHARSTAGTLELSATYWDTDELTLLRAQLGLRHRSAAGEPGSGRSRPASRMSGRRLSRGDRLRRAARPAARGSRRDHPQAVGEVVLHPVASLVTDRHTVDLVAGDTRRPRSPTIASRSVSRIGPSRRSARSRWSCSTPTRR